ncbi:hypothetical protein BDF19DRAFT_410911 [Syncephalis fuscata]|nr:hypothetical protein BDF19DRAFT_410911 [Syncephalis fuscata]
MYLEDEEGMVLDTPDLIVLTRTSLGRVHFLLYFSREEYGASFGGTVPTNIELMTTDPITPEEEEHWKREQNSLAHIADIIDYPPLTRAQSQELAKVKPLTATINSRLTQSIDEHWKSTRLDREEVNLRRQVAAQIQRHVSQYNVYSDCKVVLFGSSNNGLASKNGDLDLNLECDVINAIMENYEQQSQRRLIKQHIENLGNILRRAGYRKVVAIGKARVPLVKFVDPHAHLECDLTITNQIARRKTRLIEAYADADPRVRPLFFAVKRWAKVRKIGDASEQGGATINSYTHSLMLLAFLQRAKVIPILQSICCNGSTTTTTTTNSRQRRIDIYGNGHEYDYDYNEGDGIDLANALAKLSMQNNNGASSATDKGALAFANGTVSTKAYPTRACLICNKTLPSVIVEGYDTYFYDGVPPPSPNRQSTGQLLIEFFRFYGFVFNHKDHCVSPRLGGLVSRTAKGWGNAYGSAGMRRNRQPAAFCVEDPFALDHNCAVSAESSFWPGLRWEYQRALRALLKGHGLDEIHREWINWPSAVYGALGIWQ